MLQFIWKWQTGTGLEQYSPAFMPYNNTEKPWIILKRPNSSTYSKKCSYSENSLAMVDCPHLPIKLSAFEWDSVSILICCQVLDNTRVWRDRLVFSEWMLLDKMVLQGTTMWENSLCFFRFCFSFIFHITAKQFAWLTGETG